MEQLNLVTSVEMMKNDAIIRDVVKQQQSRKHRTAMQARHVCVYIVLLGLVRRLMCVYVCMCVCVYVCMYIHSNRASTARPCRCCTRLHPPPSTLTPNP